MFYKYTHKLQDHSPLKKLLHTANSYTFCAFFITSQNDFFAAIGAKQSIILNEATRGFEKLEKFQKRCSGQIAGYMAYDFNTESTPHKLHHAHNLHMPKAVFFEPIIWLKYAGKEVVVSANEEGEIRSFIEKFNRQKPKNHNGEIIDIKPTTTQAEYVKQAKIIQRHIKAGNIEAVNYCIQFVGKTENFNQVLRFLHLQRLTEAPFSVFAKLNDDYILSASPERYLKNENNTVISQPIKGTIRRSLNSDEDRELKDYLSQNKKEKAENTVTAHLVKNEFEAFAVPGSVYIDKLREVQTFKTVHHLVSTVSAQIDIKNHNPWSAIKHTFPMASMTGVPKQKAIQLIDEIENFDRGTYSGAFGWMAPNGDFDFNVLIRTLLYSKTNRKIALAVGSAITSGSDILQEYNECHLKAEAILKSLKMTANELD